MLTAMWYYRGFILESIKREFQTQYTNSLLGAVWTVLKPLSMIFVYTVIFSQIMRAKLPGVSTEYGYSIYLCAGVLTWSLFSETVVRLQNVFLEYASALKKINFPRLCLPIIIVLNALINFGIIFGLFTVFLLISGDFPGQVYFALVPVLLVQTLFTVGLGVTLGVLNVFFRDVGQFFGILLQFWFWLTPVVYPLSILPEGIRHAVLYNPMTVIISSYQGILVSGLWPNWHSLGIVALMGIILCLIALRLFRRHSGEMVDEL